MQLSVKIDESRVSKKLLALSGRTVFKTLTVLAKKTDHFSRDYIPWRTGAMFFAGNLNYVVRPKSITFYNPVTNPRDGYAYARKQYFTHKTKAFWLERAFRKALANQRAYWGSRK